MAGYQAYPYAQRENPRRTRIIAAGNRKWSGWPESGMEFWRLLAKMVDEEPVHERDRMVETAGYAKQLRSDRRRT